MLQNRTFLMFGTIGRKVPRHGSDVRKPLHDCDGIFGKRPQSRGRLLRQNKVILERRSRSQVRVNCGAMAGCSTESKGQRGGWEVRAGKMKAGIKAEWFKIRKISGLWKKRIGNKKVTGRINVFHLTDNILTCRGRKTWAWWRFFWGKKCSFSTF